MADATRALKMNPHCTKAVISRGEALYSMGQFEKGLVQFERGSRVRSDLRMKSGLMQCKDAILNAVGPNAREFDIELVGKVIKDMEDRKNAANNSNTPGQQQLKTRKQIRNERKRREAKRKRIDRVLLGQVAKDATFLRSLVGYDKDVVPRADTPEQKKILEIATDALEYLEKRKIFWQQTASCTV